jgi:WD40 repeat protein
LLAAATASGPVALLAGDTGEVAATLPGHPDGTLTLAWSPRDRRLATGRQDGRARLWDPTTGREMAALEGGAAWVEHLAWSDAPYLLATAAGRRLNLWSADGQLIRTAEPPHTSTISGLVWHPGQRRFATSCYGSVRLHLPLKSEPADVFEYQGSLNRGPGVRQALSTMRLAKYRLQPHSLSSCKIKSHLLFLTRNALLPTTKDSPR